MRAARILGITLFVSAALVACQGSRPSVATLYRSETLGDTARIHVATFDTQHEDEGYNQAGCERTRELYQVQPANLARYWCETGRFREKR